MEGDLEKAQICFQKALDEFGMDPADLPPLLITHSDLSFEKPLIAELKAQWEENLGITIETREKNWNDFSSALERGNFELAGLFRRDLYNDPFFYLSFFQPSPFNSHSWDNREYERLLTLYSQEENPAETITKIEQLIMEEVPAIPLVNQRYLILQNERIKGMHWNENGCLDLNEAWINETSNNILATTLTNLGMSNRE